MSKKTTKQTTGKKRAGNDRQKTAAPPKDRTHATMRPTATGTTRKAARVAQEPVVELLIDRDGIHSLTKRAKAPTAPAKADAAPQRGETEELVVFAIRLTKAERDAIHAAAGPGKATKFVRSLAVAAARGDGPTVLGILDAVQK
jgi:hypothetical protein